uniref:transformer-2 protein homolog alpha-like isoform X2 n=1 Tax=Myxine glutinosa TaxID=7769 RepID=UPI00359018CE
MSDIDEEAPTMEHEACDSQAASTTSPCAEPAADNGKKAEEEDQGDAHSHSGSEQPATKRSGSHSRSHSRSRSYRRYGRSHSRSRRRRSRSRSGSLNYRHRHRSISHSPLSNRRRHIGNRVCTSEANPNISGCLGVFGLSLYTSERDLRDVFSRYGPISEVKVVFDQQTGRSRGFAFVYFEADADAKEAKAQANGMELDGRSIRVDFSITKRPHTPTPGVYMGRPTYPTGYREAYRDPNFNDRGSYDRNYDRGYEKNYDRGYDRDYERNYNRYDDYNYRMDRYRRTPSPDYRGRYRSRSRSYSPRRY